MEKKQKSNNQKNLILNTKGKVAMTFIISAAVFLLVVIFMYIESQDGKLIINNNTDLNLNYVKGKFVSSADDLTDEINTNTIKAGASYQKEMDPINLVQMNANYEIRCQFEGYDELLIDAGTFDDTFEGNIKINFKKTDDPNLIKVTIKASNGILPSKSIKCNEEYTINLKEGKVIE